MRQKCSNRLSSTTTSTLLRGALTISMSCISKEHLDDDNENASDKLGHNDFCTIGIWEGHWLQKRRDSWNCQAMSIGRLAMSTQTKTLLAMATGSVGTLTRAVTPNLAFFPHLTRWALFCLLAWTCFFKETDLRKFFGLAILMLSQKAKGKNQIAIKRLS